MDIFDKNPMLQGVRQMMGAFAKSQIRPIAPRHDAEETMMSADSDDRVDPMHARKFTAAIQWATSSQAPALIRIEKNAGHGGADLVKQSVARYADQYAFLLEQLR